MEWGRGKSEDRMCYKGQEEAHREMYWDNLGEGRRARRSEELFSWGIMVEGMSF